MRIAIGQLAQEVNTFAPVLTTLGNHVANRLVYGEEIIKQYGNTVELGGFIQAARAAGDVELVPTMAAWAMPLGRLTRDAHQFLRNKLLDLLHRAGPLDGILLSLHGAMSAEDSLDIEGDLLADIRREWGPGVRIGISLDHHANITQKTIDNADILVGYHLQPHVDLLETGYRAAELLFAAVRGQTKPVVRWRKLPMLAAGDLRVPAGPLGPFFAEISALEKQDRVLSVSIFPEFMFSDTPEAGWCVVANTDDAPELAQGIADRLAKGLWEQRRAFRFAGGPTPAEAVARAMQVDGGPVVLGDHGDMTGGGAYGDGTAILKEVLGKDLGGKAIVPVVDPEAVAKCIAAGVGSELTLEVGGKVDRVHFTPVRVTGHVRLISDGRYDSPFGPMNMKRTVVLDVGDVHLMVSEIAGLNTDPRIYRSVGLEPKDAKLVVVKMAYNFRAYYGPFAKEMIVVNSPGVCSQDLTTFPFKRVRRPLYPLDEDARFQL